MLKPLTRAELREGLVERRPDDHKGEFGHALIVAGSRGMSGAAILAARGALRSGAGLVTVAAPKSIVPEIAAAIPSAMTLPLPDNAHGILRPDGVDRLKNYARERRVSCAAIGPGLTTHPDAARFTLHALAALPVPAVVDADAINALAQEERAGVAQMLRARGRACAFTPHPGEIARALKSAKPLGEADRQRAAERLARDWGGVVLLKGRRTIVTSGARSVVNPTGGPGLAKGGSGDVLAGLIAGLWAQAAASGRVVGDQPFLCAALGAWLHGTAGDLAERDLTAWGVCSEDLPDYLPRALAAL